jgi:nascent polypeptide-associated complex subunit alpha
MNERQMRMMMKRAGISQEEISDVDEVLIRAKTKEYLFRRPNVIIINAQGQTMYQVIGEPEVYKRGEAPVSGKKTEEEGKPGIRISDDDVALVAEKAGVGPEEARKALEECDGQPAEAIIKLMSR